MYVKNVSQLSLVDRITSPTPKFFRRLRNIGLILAAISTTIIAAPIALPAIVLNIAGYVALASTVVTAVSQTTVETEVPAEDLYDHNSE
jgi:hypothetical protein